MHSHPSEAEVIIRHQLYEGADVLRRVADTLAETIGTAAEWITETIDAGGKVLLCGNGGSAADAQHIAAELVGRFRRERSPWPAIALTTDTSVLTAVANDYGFDEVFARQVHALSSPGDVLIGLSTSGSSRNVVAAAQTAREFGARVIALTGPQPGPLGAASDLTLGIPAPNTALIQQAHLAILHTICDLVESRLAAKPGPVSRQGLASSAGIASPLPAGVVLQTS
jgi:D-sedoheptulose 7-phosphate isomerase